MTTMPHKLNFNSQH